MRVSVMPLSRTPKTGIVAIHPPPLRLLTMPMTDFPSIVLMS
jgi:hypothetical protein